MAINWNCCLTHKDKGHRVEMQIQFTCFLVLFNLFYQLSHTPLLQSKTKLNNRLYSLPLNKSFNKIFSPSISVCYGKFPWTTQRHNRIPTSTQLLPGLRESKEQWGFSSFSSTCISLLTTPYQQCEWNALSESSAWRNASGKFRHLLMFEIIWKKHFKNLKKKSNSPTLHQVSILRKWQLHLTSMWDSFVDHGFK